MKILGTSTLHDWTVVVTKASGTGSISMESNKLKEIKFLQIVIPGKDLKSESGSNKMNDKIYESLKIKTCPDITFKLKHIISYPDASNGNLLSALGTFTIGGVSREETLKVLTKVTDNSSVSFSGDIKIKMTDYNIKPPTAMIGMMSTGNEVELKFDCTMQKTN